MHGFLPPLARCGRLAACNEREWHPWARLRCHELQRAIPLIPHCASMLRSEHPWSEAPNQTSRPQLDIFALLFCHFVY